MDDELSPIENFLEKSSNQIKWTASIAIFLITASLTIFTFKESISPITTWLVLASLMLLILSVFFSWKVTQKCSNLQRAILDARSLPMGNVDEHKKNEISKNVESIAKKIESNAKWHHYTFISGFFTFLISIIGYLVFEKLIY